MLPHSEKGVVMGVCSLRSEAEPRQKLQKKSEEAKKEKQEVGNQYLIAHG